MNVNKININQTEPTYYIASDIYDVSYHNNGTFFESLQSLLSSDNLSTLIPSAVRCGGMSIRFIQSSDNKYVQYRLMSNEFTTDITQWQGIDEEPTYESDNIVKSGGTQKSIILGDTYIEGLIQSINVPFKYDGFWYLHNNEVLTKLTSYNCYYTDKITFL